MYHLDNRQNFEIPGFEISELSRASPVGIEITAKSKARKQYAPIAKLFPRRYIVIMSGDQSRYLGGRSVPDRTKSSIGIFSKILIAAISHLLNAFRKSFAQNHADAGTPPRTLAKLLGHSNTRVTMQYYARVTDANERAAAEAMNRLLSAPRPNKDAV